MQLLAQSLVLHYFFQSRLLVYAHLKQLIIIIIIRTIGTLQIMGIIGMLNYLADLVFGCFNCLYRTS